MTIRTLLHRSESTPQSAATPAVKASHGLLARGPVCRGLLSTLVASMLVLLLTACAQNIYHIPEFTFAGRPVPPSLLQQRVMVSFSPSGNNGALQVLDGLRDIRNNVPNTIPAFPITGFNGGSPTLILNYPEELRGYVYSNQAPYAVTIVNYSTEAAAGSGASLTGPASSLAQAPDFLRLFAAEEQNGQLIINDNQGGAAYALNLPGVYRVAVNRGDTIALAMVRNSNALYRVIKLNINAPAPPGAVDCQPTILPVYCVVPVPGKFDRPYDAVFAVDGSSAYVLNCGVECGGGANGGSGVSLIPQGPLTINIIPTSLPYPAVVTSTVPVAGGVTTALSDGNSLYLAGQQLQPDGLFAGRLSTLNLNTLAVSAPVSISDGTHSKLIFGDDNTLWIGSQFCATGERAKLGLNYNCLTRYDLGTGAATIVPALVKNPTTGLQSVPYPNSDNNLAYYGSLTGICWVQNYHKMYTAYGGQVHAFSTVDGSEINNYLITVQGTALDVAFIDATTNSAN